MQYCTKKNRGAQPGSQDKNGFYSHLFWQQERCILDQQPPTDVAAETELDSADDDSE
ncbi:MAG TPA: hypothetical protein VFH29_04780 [Anaerolineales bacterium]|nr:hypothetical protein [Anaerolineales bacterium]